MSDFLVFQVAIFDNGINGVSRVLDDQVGVSTPQKGLGKKERLLPRQRYTTQGPLTHERVRERTA